MSKLQVTSPLAKIGSQDLLAGLVPGGRGVTPLDMRHGLGVHLGGASPFSPCPHVFAGQFWCTLGVESCAS